MLPIHVVGIQAVLTCLCARWIAKVAIDSFLPAEIAVMIADMVSD